MKLKLTVAFFISILGHCYSQIVINEYSAANMNSTADNYGEFEDWIELYNTGGVDVDITGWYFSDKVTKPLKNLVTGGVVPSGGYLKVFCSGRDEFSGGNLHTSFKLTQTKPEEILISDAGGILVDQIQMVPCQLGHSRGRTADGASTWALFTSPTIGAPNTNAQQEYATKPLFDIASGIQAGNISLTISSPDANVSLYYTNDGSTPSAGSTPVSGAIALTTNTIIRCIAISSDPNIPQSFIETNTYFFNISHTMKILSICGDEVMDFINDQAPGSFSSNFRGALEFFTSAGVLIDEGEGEYNKHGNDSWAYGQRGIDFIMRDQFGYNYAIQDQIYRGKSRTSHQRLMIKAAANDNVSFQPGGAHIRDAYVQSLSQVGDLKMDERSFEPAVLYVNGEYWGLYEIREKVGDSDFTSYYYDQDEKYSGGPNDVQFLRTWGGTWEEMGAPNAQNDWNTLANFITGNDMSIQANFDYVDSVFNWKSLVDYFCLNSYIVSADWLNWNTSWWRGLNPDGDKKKWRYTLWDMDATFGHYTNYTNIPDQGATADPCAVEALPNPGGQGHTEIMMELMNNPTFEQYYISRYIDLGNTVFSCDYMLGHLDSLISLITPEMPAQVARWGSSIATWEANVQTLRDFITDRCVEIETGLVDCYDLVGPYEVTYDVVPVASGTIKVNSTTLDQYPWTGTYYGGIDILLKANANPGFIFDYWESSISDPINPAADSVDASTSITGIQTIKAHFRTEGTPPTPTFEGVYVPTGFSPNNDGNNDLLQTYIGGNVEDFLFVIYNRWGEKIFETDDRLSLWDGTYKGVELSTSVFVYKINVQYIDGTTEVKGGNITLVRNSAN